jgi:stage II sporulation protein D
VTSLSVGGVSLTGNRLRTILELRSACFTMAFQEDTVTFSVTGYGHGVGMSQYGANVLAAGGMDYREILTWYYSGAEVDTWTE